MAGGAGADWLGVAGPACDSGAVSLALGLVLVLVLVLVLAAAAVPPLTVTSGAIFLMVLAETPAFDNSSIEEYGRPAMIFFAVTGPTPGKLSKSFSLAVFKSTLALVFVEVAAAAYGVLAFLLFVCWANEQKVRTPHANTVVDKRRTTPVRDIFTRSSFCAAFGRPILCNQVEFFAM